MFDSKEDALVSLRKIDDKIVPGGYKADIECDGLLVPGGFSAANYEKKQYGRGYFKKY